MKLFYYKKSYYLTYVLETQATNNYQQIRDNSG